MSALILIQTPIAWAGPKTFTEYHTHDARGVSAPRLVPPPKSALLGVAAMEAAICCRLHIEEGSPDIPPPYIRACMYGQGSHHIAGGMGLDQYSSPVYHVASQARSGICSVAYAKTTSWYQVGLGYPA